MKYDLSIRLVSYDGKPFTRPAMTTDGQPVVHDGVPQHVHLTLKDVLTSACVNADPQEHNDSDKKLAIFKLLMKLHSALPFVHLSAEEVSLLKKLVGKQLTVIAVGAVCHELENPVQDREKTD